MKVLIVFKLDILGMFQTEDNMCTIEMNGIVKWISLKIFSALKLSYFWA